MSKTSALIVLMLVSFSLMPSATTLQGQSIEFEFQPGPVNNPLKGLVPYWDQHGPFSCSMEFGYFPIDELMTGPGEFNWQPIEEKLEDMKSRGHQAVIRPFLEVPGKKSGVPAFLLKQGVKISKYKTGDGENLTPDYRNPKLITAMENFIAAFGKKYDGDPRVGFITMGVLGQWGEWHTYPHAKLFATKPAQKQIQDAFAKAFKKNKSSHALSRRQRRSGLRRECELPVWLSRRLVRLCDS